MNVIAYWLLPAAPARDYFRALVQRLAAENDALAFEPHLTLAVGPDEPGAVDVMLAGRTSGVIAVRPVEVAFSSIFTRTLFVRFEANSALQQLRKSLGGCDREPFDPHLSLLYKKLSPLCRAELAKQIQLPFVTVAFDSVAATRCRIPIESVADVGLWETVGTRPL